MDEYVKLNSDWLSHYDNTSEVNKIMLLTSKLGFFNKEAMQIADVGCGNGRFTKCISKLFYKSSIYAIDNKKENLDLAKKNINDFNVEYICADAFDFFKNNMQLNLDIIFFSWSLFDMVSIFNQTEKEKKLKELISSAKKSLKRKGYIIVLQPTKGGVFEKLLSKFMPGSDEDYFITHKFLINNGFYGPNTPFPEKDNYQAIWSNFICDSSELFDGIKSIVMLETGRLITKEEFDIKFNSFMCEYSVEKNNLLYLSDCVSIYYLAGEK